MTYLNEPFKWHFYSLSQTIVPNYFEIDTYRSYGPDKSEQTNLQTDSHTYTVMTNYI